jgi:hypothetical protein
MGFYRGSIASRNFWHSLLLSANILPGGSLFMSSSPGSLPRALALSRTDPWSLVPALGNLEAYISAANRLPILSADEELRLARQWRDHEDLKAAGQLVLSHLRLVISIARQYMGYGCLLYTSDAADDIL